jgi:hypothetical protein
MTPVRATVCGLVIVALWVQQLSAQALAEDGAGSFSLPRARDLVAGFAPRGDLLASVLSPRRAEQSRPPRVSVDLGPVVNGALEFLQHHGIPLRHDQELSGEHGFVFSAAFQFDETLPPMDLHIGDGGPLDAFYANEGGFRLALEWTVPWFSPLALNVAAGEDSEFGNWAIAGVQWRHPRRPLAIGLGMPVALSNADGDIGVVCQFRMLLE